MFLLLLDYVGFCASFGEPFGVLGLMSLFFAPAAVVLGLGSLATLFSR